MDGLALSTLRACAIFREWPDAALWHIARRSEVTSHKRGVLLHRRGDAQSRLYIATEGALELSRVLPDGRRYVLPYLPPGVPVGLPAILADEPALFDVRTRLGTTLVHVRRDILKEFLLSHTELLVTVASAISRRYCDLFEQLEMVAMLSLRQRLALVILKLAGSFGVSNERGVSLSLRVSQDDLAALTAASRQRVNIEFRQFMEEGLLASSYGSITILDPEGLRRKGGPAI